MVQISVTCSFECGNVRVTTFLLSKIVPLCRNGRVMLGLVCRQTCMLLSYLQVETRCVVNI